MSHPAINYQIWQEFKLRTDIYKELIFEYNNLNEKIDKMASKLIENLDITDDDKIINKITPYFIGKTRKDYVGCIIK